MKFILINPPIYDFSAYDVWIKPLGLLYLSSILKSKNHEVVLLDYLDRNFFPEIPTKSDGTGKFFNYIVEKPKIFSDVPLKYKRYGIPPNKAEDFLSQHRDADCIIITCTMTYWYPGVKEVIDTVHKIIPKANTILGGIYPILVPEHAISTFADKINIIFTKQNFVELLKYLGYTDNEIYYNKFSNFPIPDYTLYKKVWYIVTRFSYGCFNNCIYCASKKLYPNYSHKPVEKFLHEIKTLYSYTQCTNFVFYDDALFNNDNTINLQLLTGLTKLNLPLNFFTPNGLNPKFINKQIAQLMYNANFVDPRLSIETIHTRTHQIVDNKVLLKDFETALKNLTLAGYKPQQISVYILAGLPNETIEDVYKSIETMSLYKVRIRLCELSIIPQTKLFQMLSLDNSCDPLLYNNTTFLFTGIQGKVKPWCSYEELQQLKNYVKNLNQQISLYQYV